MPKQQLKRKRTADEERPTEVSKEQLTEVAANHVEVMAKLLSGETVARLQVLVGSTSADIKDLVSKQSGHAVTDFNLAWEDGSPLASSFTLAGPITLTLLVTTKVYVVRLKAIVLTRSGESGVGDYAVVDKKFTSATRFTTSKDALEATHELLEATECLTTSGDFGMPASQASDDDFNYMDGDENMIRWKDAGGNNFFGTGRDSYYGYGCLRLSRRMELRMKKDKKGVKGLLGSWWTRVAYPGDEETPGFEDEDIGSLDACIRITEEAHDEDTAILTEGKAHLISEAGKKIRMAFRRQRNLDLDLTDEEWEERHQEYA